MTRKMKTSDKLLLGVASGVLILLCVIHLLLHNNYRKGNIVSAAALHDEGVVKFRLPEVHYLFLTGTIWVNIIPSDSFYIELPQTPGLQSYAGQVNVLAKFNTDTQTPGYHQLGDTLWVTGGNDQMIHRPFADWVYQLSLPQVYVHCRHLKEIRLHKGQLYLQGPGDGEVLSPVQLKIDSSTAWIGQFLENSHRPVHKEFFDSLDIQSTNSILLLNTPANIRVLHARLDDESEINDRRAVLGHAVINCNSDSRVNLTGDNIGQTQLTFH
jgi:hypothetical protein